jgi:hypothetical protein
MIRVFLDNNSKVTRCLTGAIELIELNTREDDVFVDVDAASVKESDYWDGLNFISIGESPSHFHIFDYSIKQWIDPRTLDEIKDQKWSSIKAERDTLEFGGFVYNSNTYDSDQVSQGRIMGAASAGVDQVWTLADNTTVELTAQQLKELYIALQSHIANAHERGRVARQAIYEATTAEQVEAIAL